jgi:hypothetical protein
MAGSDGPQRRQAPTGEWQYQGADGYWYDESESAAEALPTNASATDLNISGPEDESASHRATSDESPAGHGIRETKTRTSRTRWFVIGGAALVVAVVAVVVVLATGGNSSNAALQKWYSSYGRHTAGTFTVDINTLNNDFNFENLSQDCGNFNTDIQAALGNPPPPVDSSEWTSQLNQALQDSATCQSQGINDTNAAQAMLSHLEKAVRILATASNG